MKKEIINTGVVEIDEFKLRYCIEGEGPPAIVIGCAVYYPRVFSQKLRKHLQMIFVDHRGFTPFQPKQPKENAAYELDVLIDDIEHIRQKLGLGQIIVIGHSAHAFMALEYAKKYSKHVSHVVMIGIAPSFSAVHAAAAEQYWQDFASPDRKAAHEKAIWHLPDAQLDTLSSEQRFIKGYVRNGARIWYNFQYDSSPLWKDVSINMTMFDYVWGKVFREIDITRRLNEFNKPVFLGLGRYDFLVAPPSSWDPIRPKFQDLTVRIFEKSGHTPQYEEPELFDNELLRWLS